MDIEITRPKQYQDILRDYHLIVDGKKIAKIKHNSKSTITIPDDAEYIQAKIDWCSSPKLYIREIKSNQILIQNRFRGNFFKALFSMLYYVTFGKNKYLTIKSAT